MKFALIAVIVGLSSCVEGLPQMRLQLLDEGFTSWNSWMSKFGISKPKFACRNGLFGPTLPIIVQITRCMLSEMEQNENLNSDCLYFCAANAFDLLDPLTGLPTKEKYHDLVLNNFPNHLITKTMDHFDECLDKYGSFDLNDKNCTQAGLLHVCTWSMVDEMVC